MLKDKLLLMSSAANVGGGGGSYYQRGALYATGDNTEGELGLGDTEKRYNFTRVAGYDDWDYIAAGYNQAFGIRGGKLYGWGMTRYGQLGNGQSGEDAPNVTVPMQIGTDSDWVKVSTAGGHTLAIKSNGTLWATGENNSGECGLGYASEEFVTTFTQVGTYTDWTDITVNNNYSFGIRAGRLYAWGSNLSNNLGLNDTVDRHSPIQVGTDTNWKKVVSYGHVLLLKTDGTLWAFGHTNTYGQLGTGDTNPRYVPTKIGTFADWSHITCVGGIASIGIRGGSLYSCGYYKYNGQGQESGYITTMTQIGTHTDWTDAEGQDGSAVLAVRNNQLYVWGQGAAGQLGLGKESTISLYTPTLVPNIIPDKLATGNASNYITIKESSGTGLTAPGDYQLIITTYNASNSPISLIEQRNGKFNVINEIWHTGGFYRPAVNHNGTIVVGDDNTTGSWITHVSDTSLSTPVRPPNMSQGNFGGGGQYSTSISNTHFAVASYTTGTYYPFIDWWSYSGTSFTKLTSPTPPTGYPRCCSWDPSGNYLAVGHDSSSDNSTVTMYSRSGSLLTKLSSYGHNFDAAYNLIWALNGQVLIQSGGTQGSRFYTHSGGVLTYKGEITPQSSMPNSTRHFSVSPDGDLGCIRDEYYLRVYSISTSSITQIEAISMPKEYSNGVTWSPDGLYAVIINRGPDVNVSLFKRQDNTLKFITSEKISDLYSSGYSDFIHYVKKL